MMIDEIQQKFYDTFDIKSEKQYYCPGCDSVLTKLIYPDNSSTIYLCTECDYVLESSSEDFNECLNDLSFRMIYPVLTDERLLKLICIRQKYIGTRFNPVNIYKLKNQLLKDLFIEETLRQKSENYCKDLYNDVRKIVRFNNELCTDRFDV